MNKVFLWWLIASLWILLVMDIHHIVEHGTVLVPSIIDLIK